MSTDLYSAIIRREAELAQHPSQNDSWGFWGTMQTRGRIREAAIREQAWPMALVAVSSSAGCSLEDARAFLDSHYGRHFADEVDNQLHDNSGSLTAAITATATRYTEEWKVTRLTLDTLPRSVRFNASIGAPLLVALVAASQIND